MSSPLLGAYRPGTTLLHRLSAGSKLLIMAVLSIAGTLIRGPYPALALLGFALLMVAWSRMPVRLLVTTLARLAVILSLLTAYLLWRQSWQRAVETVGELTALVLLATVLTVTTPVDEILDTITASLRPFRRFGVKPESVGLAFSLTLRAIPSTLEVARHTREAALARGLERSPRAYLVPLVIRVVASARLTGEALLARGIGDDPID